MNSEEQQLEADVQQMLQHPELMNHMARTILLLTEHSERQQRQVNDLIELCKIQQKQIDEQKLQIIFLDQFVQFLNTGIQELNKIMDPS